MRGDSSVRLKTMWRFLAPLVLLGLFSSVLQAGTHLILPFFNLSKDASVEWVGESLAETIHDALSGSGVLVLSRSDREEAFRRLRIRPYTPLTRASVLKLGQALDAGTVIYGTYQLNASAAPNAEKTNRTIRITARILDLEHTKLGPEYGESGSLNELAQLQNRLAWETLRFVRPKSAPSQEVFKRQNPPARVDAIENYIRGLLATDVDQQHRFFTQAARLDDTFFKPYYPLGKLQWAKENYGVAAGWLAKVPEEDRHYREANFLLGLCRYFLGDYESAEKAFSLVLQTVPLNEVYNNLGATLSQQGRFPAALTNFRKALDGDSTDPDYHFNIGYVLWKEGNFSDAAESFRAVLERDSEDSEAKTMLSRCLKASGSRPGDPNADLERLKEDFNETVYLQLIEALGPKS